MDAILKKYRVKITKSNSMAKKLEDQMATLCNNLQEAIDKNILTANKGHNLPSHVSGRIMDGKHKTVLMANRDVYKASQVFQEIKELAQIRIMPKANEINTDMKSLRDSLVTEFQSDIDVLTALKTVKNLDNGFDLLFADVVNSYNKIKNYYNTIIHLVQYLSEGLMSLGSLSKYLYNYSQMEQTEMVNEERMQTGMSSNARDSVLKDLKASRTRTPTRSTGKTFKEETVKNTRRSRA